MILDCGTRHTVGIGWSSDVPQLDAYRFVRLEPLGQTKIKTKTKQTHTLGLRVSFSRIEARFSQL